MRGEEAALREHLWTCPLVPRSFVCSLLSHHPLPLCLWQEGYLPWASECSSRTRRKGILPSSWDEIFHGVLQGQVIGPAWPLGLGCLGLFNCHRGAKRKCWHSASPSPGDCSGPGLALCCLLALRAGQQLFPGSNPEPAGPIWQLRLNSSSSQAAEGPPRALFVRETCS